MIYAVKIALVLIGLAIFAAAFAFNGTPSAGPVPAPAIIGGAVILVALTFL